MMVGRFLALMIGLCVSALPAAAQKRIAFTFDDAPRSRGAFLTPDERTRRLIAGLKTAGVRQAAFFVNPGNLALPDGAGGEARLAAYVAAGHVIANHSFSHPHLSTLTASAYLGDIDRAEAWLKGRRGYRAWFRYPFLDEGGTDRTKRDAVRGGLHARGLSNGYVTADGSDWQLEAMTQAAAAAGKPMDMAGLKQLYVAMMMEGVETHDANARRILSRSPVHVMLMHETDLAALFLPDFIAALKAKGWRIATVDEAYADPLSRMVPDPTDAHGTVQGQIADQKGITGLKWPAMADARVAERLFEQQVLATAR